MGYATTYMYGEHMGKCGHFCTQINSSEHMGSMWGTYGQHMGNIWETYGEHMGNIWNRSFLSDVSPCGFVKDSGKELFS